jgi:hypothetical protein
MQLSCNQHGTTSLTGVGAEQLKACTLALAISKGTTCAPERLAAGVVLMDILQFKHHCVPLQMPWEKSLCLNATAASWLASTNHGMCQPVNAFLRGTWCYQLRSM